MKMHGFTAPDAHILIVDDMPVNHKIISGILGPLGAHMEFAINGSDALKKINNHRFDLVFMDYMMPEMDGVEAVKALRSGDDEYSKKLPVIALSSCATDDILKLFEESGFTDDLTKPIDIGQLISCIEKYLPPEKIINSSEDIDISDELEAEEMAMSVDIPGIDPSLGIRYSGGAPFFIELLGDVHEILDEKVKLIETHLANNEIKEYTTQVHALKTTCRMIGDIDLSNEFFELEKLGTAGDVEQIKSLTPKTLSTFKSLKPYLEPYVPSKADADKDFDKKAVASQLKGLCDAITDFDLNEAEEHIKSLISFRYPPELSSQITELEELVDGLDYDEAKDLATTILNKLD